MAFFTSAKLALAERILAGYQPKVATRTQRANAIDRMDATGKFTTDQIAKAVGCSESTVTRRRGRRNGK